jgi:membrane-bound ClpP family serine protease
MHVLVSQFLFPLLAVALPLLVIAFFALQLALHARRAKKRVEAKSMIGLTGRAESIIFHTGLIFVRGELWHACSEKPIARGESVRAHC